jgi:hypothetical protein
MDESGTTTHDPHHQLISDRQLRKVIDGLRNLERNCFASKNRFAFYNYLAAVFEPYVQLRQSNQAKPLARRIDPIIAMGKSGFSRSITPHPMGTNDS